MKKKILYGILAVLVIIQFIRPTRNISDAVSPNEIATAYATPDEVQNILKQSCYDCHSNNTQYPWYANVQPVGWWLQNHINGAKKELNFSEFGTYTEKRAKHKFEEIADEVREHEMPLKSYLILHADARLTPEQTEMLTNWAEGLKK